jgi:hypothetical protein
MRSSLAHPYKPFPLTRVALIAALTLLLSGWTCRAIFLSCQGVAQSQVTSLSPDAIQSNAESVLLTVAGSGFTPQSQIMWNGNVAHDVHGRTPRPDNGHSADLRLLWWLSGEQCADFSEVSIIVQSFGMSNRRELCHAGSSHQLGGLPRPS